MSGRLDQSLDSIVKTQKERSRGRARRVVAAKRASAATATPVGGVKKSTRQAKPAVRGATAAAVNRSRDSKIVVSGLPFDVNESQIKEYFNKSVGTVKKVSLQYNQSGASRGIADILFSKPDSAAKAAKELNGMLVDKRPMKIEVVVSATDVPKVPAVKSLADRVAYAIPQQSKKSAPLTKNSANPKAQPKSATAVKATSKDAKGRPAKRGAKKGGKPDRPKRKTVEELDAEMTDYFGGNTTGAIETNGTTAPAATTATTEDAMDEIS